MCWINTGISLVFTIYCSQFLRAAQWVFSFFDLNVSLNLFIFLAFLLECEFFFRYNAIVSMDMDSILYNQNTWNYFCFSEKKNKKTLILIHLFRFVIWVLLLQLFNVVSFVRLLNIFVGFVTWYIFQRKIKQEKIQENVPSHR